MKTPEERKRGEKKEGTREEEKERRERPPRAHVQHASVCCFKTPPCVLAKRPHVEHMKKERGRHERRDARREEKRRERRSRVYVETVLVCTFKTPVSFVTRAF